MNCINLKQKINKTLFCKKHKKEITFKDCSNCPFKEYKTYNRLKAKSELIKRPEVVKNITSSVVLPTDQSLKNMDYLYGSPQNSTNTYMIIL